MPEIEILRTTLTLLRAQLAVLRQERGSATLEQILITITLVTAAGVVGGAILAKVNQKANAIPTGTP
jgi:hypothetical protein